MKLSLVATILAAILTPALCTSQSPKPDAPRHEESAIRPEDRVDLNHATLDQLLKIPGMTRVWALRIIRFRPYRSKQDLLDQGVLPAAVYNRIRDYVIAHGDKD